MVLRIHFTSEDLVRTHVATAADPLWEVVLGHFLLQERGPVYLRSWVRRWRSDSQWATKIRPGARLLAGLAPLGPYFPDFLTPAEACDGLGAGLEAIARTPRRRLTYELNRLASGRAGRPLPDWLSSFADAEVPALEQLTMALRCFYEAAIEPHDDVIRTSIDADLAQRGRCLLKGGIEALFRSFHPLMSWQSPVLEVRYDVDHDLHLNGRGLRLVPSYFCHGSPVSVADPELTPVLVYPVAVEHRWTPVTSRRPSPSLGKLMGATRASVLHAIDTGATTTELARALRTSPASISRHTTVLREAGLIASHRYGPAVLHTLTPLGLRLLDQPPASSEGDCPRDTSGPVGTHDRTLTMIS